MKELEFTSTHCAEDNIALSRIFFKKKFVKSALFILLIEAGLTLSLIMMEHSLRNMILIPLLMVLGIFVLFVVVFAQKKSENYIKAKELKEYTTFRFKDSCIQGETKFSDTGSVIKKDYAYSVICKFKEDKDRAYIFISKTTALVINKEDKGEELKRFLLSKAVQIYR